MTLISHDKSKQRKLQNRKEATCESTTKLWMILRFSQDAVEVAITDIIAAVHTTLTDLLDTHTDLPDTHTTLTVLLDTHTTLTVLPDIPTGLMDIHTTPIIDHGFHLHTADGLLTTFRHQ